MMVYPSVSHVHAYHHAYYIYISLNAWIMSHVQMGCAMVLNHLLVDFLRGKISVVRRRKNSVAEPRAPVSFHTPNQSYQQAQ